MARCRTRWVHWTPRGAGWSPGSERRLLWPTSSTGTWRWRWPTALAAPTSRPSAPALSSARGLNHRYPLIYIRRRSYDSMLLFGHHREEQYLVVGWQLAITGADHLTKTIVHKRNCGQDAPSLFLVTGKNKWMSCIYPNSILNRPDSQ